MQDGQVEYSGEVGAQVQDGTGEPTGAKRKRAQGQEDDDAKRTASRINTVSDSDANQVELIEQLANSPRRELAKRRIVEKEGGRKVP